MLVTGTTGVSEHKAKNALIAAALAGAAVLAACDRVILWFLGIPGRPLRGAIDYNAAIHVPSYFNVGFVRRGLGGTIYALMPGGDRLTNLAAFHLFCAVFLGVPLALILYRLVALGGRRWILLGAVVVLSPQLMLAWSVDTGKGDPLNSGFIAWALLAALDRRFLIAAAFLLVGSLAHETVVFFGLGLLIPVWFLLWRQGRVTVLQGIMAIALLGVSLVAVALLQHVYGPGPQDIIRVITQQEPPSSHRDMAAYMTAGGSKSITTSACITLHRPATALTLVAGFLILAAYTIVLQIRNRVALLFFGFAAVLPMAALSIVAIDYGRWVCMAVFNAWLVAVVLSLLQQTGESSNTRNAFSGGVLLGLLALGPTQYFYTNSMVQRISDGTWPPTAEGGYLYMDTCEPGWRAFLGIPASSKTMDASTGRD